MPTVHSNMTEVAVFIDLMFCASCASALADIALDLECAVPSSLEAKLRR